MFFFLSCLVVFSIFYCLIYQYACLSNLCVIAYIRLKAAGPLYFALADSHNHTSRFCSTAAIWLIYVFKSIIEPYLRGFSYNTGVPFFICTTNNFLVLI